MHHLLGILTKLLEQRGKEGTLLSILLTSAQPTQSKLQLHTNV